VAEYVSVGKDSVGLLRDLMIFILAVMLLLFPKVLNDTLVNAGFEEGSLVGFKWKSRLLNSDQALKDARFALDRMRVQNDSLSKALAAAQLQLTDTVLRRRIARVQTANQQLATSVSQVQRSVNHTIAASAPVVQEAQQAVAGNGEWVVVFGGDPTLRAAQYETQRVSALLKIPNTAVYLRQGSYRSVSIADTRAEADQVVLVARTRRPDAYVVNLTTWCPRRESRGAYQECVSP
jgi:hypothetical protein